MGTGAPSTHVEYQVVLEFDPETKHYTGTVPGLPIVVDAKNKRSALKLAREAIAFYLEDADSAGIPAARPLQAEVVKVKV